MSIIKDVRDRIVEAAEKDPELDAQRALEHETVRVSLRNLRDFPFVAEREREGSLKLHGAWFAIKSGKLHVLNEQNGEFDEA